MPFCVPARLQFLLLPTLVNAFLSIAILVDGESADMVLSCVSPLVNGMQISGTYGHFQIFGGISVSILGFFFLKKKQCINLYLFCMYDCLACIYVFTSHAYLMPVETRRKYWNPWGWSYRWLWAKIRVLGHEAQSSGRAARDLNHCAISPAHLCTVVVVLQHMVWT